jgi:hypothetical protein
MTKARRTADDFVRDMKVKHDTTPGDAERKERIDANAREALRRLKSGQTYEDWRAVGQKMMVITEEVMNELALNEWDKDNKQLTREFTRRFEGWEASVSNAKPISKQERWALRELMTDPKYHAFYTTELVGPEQRKTNHPNKIIEKYNRKYPDPAKVKEREERRQKELREKERQGLLAPTLSPKEIEQLQARTAELEEELAAARKPAAKETVPRNLEAARAAYLRLVIQVFGADKKAIKAEGKCASAELASLLRETIKAGSLPPTKTRKRKTKGRVLGHIPGIGNMVIED